MSDLQNQTKETNGALKPAAWRATPELDVYESGSEFWILLDVPGASAESVNVQVTGTELFVRAEQTASQHRDDVPVTVFERRLELPADVDASSAVAELRDGVLEIKIAKSSAARRVQIRVNTN